MRKVCAGVLLITALAATAPAQTSRPGTAPETIRAQTAGMQKLPGYFTLYWEEKTGKIWLEVDKFDTEFLYINSLPAGIGSNDIGLDRGQLGRTRIVKFERVGPKLLLVQPNYRYRAISENALERRAVEQAFARSVLWGFDISAEEGSRALVDATQFFLRDAHNVTGRLRATGQGSYKLDASRSAIYLPRTKSFPKNTEVEATLTFTGEPKHRYIRSVAPSPEAVTVRQHHSFVELPDGNYRPRAFDPRAGFSGIQFMDYATPIGEPIVKRYIARHRLRKKNPRAAKSEPVEPIVYYLDPGTPEPVRSALLEGAGWWNQAFEAAGYIDAFQVKMLPADADPMDVRYNLIQWVHRSTRGWSYGSSVRDPRTGEIIKGHVSLGSLRVRQDYLIAEGLLAPYADGTTVPPEMLKMALARIRQLAAHEVGHTLGLAHNYIASTAGRASVMDYPHPLARIDSRGRIDLSQAYDDKIGAWDKVTIAYGYQDFPDEVDEHAALDKILLDARERGLIFITDQDARPPGSAHPQAHLWDNGTNAAGELLRVLGVRRKALETFSLNNIRTGAPVATLEHVFVPVYLFHRYQTEAAAKMLGGLQYTFALRGDGQQPTAMVPGAEQRHALDALLQTITPQNLAVPERILRLLPPRAFGYSRGRELFDIRTGPTFDPVAAAETAAEMTISLIFHPARAARLIEYHARNKNLPGLIEVADRVIAATWKSAPKSAYYREIQQAVSNTVLAHLMQLAADTHAASQARAIALLKIDELKQWLREAVRKEKDESRLAHFTFALRQIDRFEENPDDFKASKPPVAPAGSPIGAGLQALPGAGCSFSW